MFKLERLNVVKIVETEYERDKLISKGFKEVVETPEESNEGKPLDEMTVPELKAMAKEKGIEGHGNMKKEELLEVLGELESGE
jgi:hypothetical protein